MGSTIAKAGAVLAIVLVAVGGAFVLLTGMNAGQKEIFVEGVTLEEARAEAQHSGRHVLVLALATWCPHCATLDREALRDDGVQAAIREHTIPVRYHITSRQLDIDAWDEVERLNVREVPALILYDPSGREVSRLTGVVGAEELEMWVASNGKAVPGETGGRGTIRRRGG